LFVEWVDERGDHLHTPDLAAYRDYLMSDERVNRYGKPSPLSPSSAAAHIHTIRGQYRKLLKSNTVRDLLYAQTPLEADPATRKALVDEYITRLENTLDPDAVTVAVPTVQDDEDAKHLRLTQSQAATLVRTALNHPANTPLMRLRDAAMIALMLSTGIREAELIALNVDDLRQTYGGKLALRVRHGKGDKKRLVVYGDMSDCLVLVEKWLMSASIEDGAVFRGFYRGSKSVRSSRLTLRAVNKVLDRYPISIRGDLRTVNPHDLRRTYAYLWDAIGGDLIALQQNLGHADLKTTLHYIGRKDGDKRAAKRLFDIDMSAMPDVLL